MTDRPCRASARSTRIRSVTSAVWPTAAPDGLLPQLILLAYMHINETWQGRTAPREPQYDTAVLRKEELQESATRQCRKMTLLMRAVTDGPGAPLATKAKLGGWPPH
jgi:hypothetical protein